VAAGRLLGLLISFIFGLVSDCLGLLIAWACWAWAWVAVWVLGCCLKFWVSCCLGLQGLGQFWWACYSFIRFYNF
jgi:hypothetical protein